MLGNHCHVSRVKAQMMAAQLKGDTYLYTDIVDVMFMQIYQSMFVPIQIICG